jgi:hypothetical protein
MMGACTLKVKACVRSGVGLATLHVSGRIVKLSYIYNFARSYYFVNANDTDKHG